MNDGDRKTQAPAAEPTLAQLLERATDQISRLVRDEMAAARAELTSKGKRAGIAAAMFGGAGGVALFAVAGLLALVGKKQTERATPLAPQATLDSVRKDVESVQQAAKEGRRR